MEYYLIPKSTMHDIYEHYLVWVALSSGGVDNWDWYGNSIQDFFKENDIDTDNFDQFIENELNERFNIVQK